MQPNVNREVFVSGAWDDCQASMVVRNYVKSPQTYGGVRSPAWCRDFMSGASIRSRFRSADRDHQFALQSSERIVSLIQQYAHKTDHDGGGYQALPAKARSVQLFQECELEINKRGILQ